MKYKLCSFIIIYLTVLANGEMLCKDSLTNEEFVANDALTDAGLKNLQNLLEQKITKSLEDLTTITKENISQLGEQLKAQIFDKSNKLESQKEANLDQFENICKKSFTFQNDLELITSLLLNITNRLDIQEQNTVENTKNVKKRLDILMLENSKLSHSVQTCNKKASDEKVNSILEKTIDLENHLNATNFLLLNIFNKLEKQEQNISMQSAIKFESTKSLSSHTVEPYNVHASNEILNSTINQKQEKLINNSDNITKTIKWPTNCKEAMEKTQKSGIYEIQLPAFGPEPFSVLCDNMKPKGNWTVVMRRFDGSVDFHRDWTEYKNGFGDLSGEFFIGLEKLHVMTSSQERQDLLILMKDINYDMQHILYDNFALGNEHEDYMIKELGEATGTVENNLKQNVKFTTKDVDLDKKIKCAHFRFEPGWRFSCVGANLFGLYDSTNVLTYMGWEQKLQSATMLIRPHK